MRYRKVTSFIVRIFCPKVAVPKASIRARNRAFSYDRKSGAERSLAAGGFLFVPVRVDLIGRHRIWRLTPFNKV
jgi:hypothetical protein